MILEPKKIATAYRCAECGNTIFGMTGALALTGDLIKLKCTCKKTEMQIKNAGDGKVRISMPCVFCQKDHSFVISKSILLSRDLFTYPCPYTGIDICFFGTEDNVSKAVEESDKSLSELLSQEEFDELSDMEKSGSEGDDVIRFNIKYVLKELLEDNAVTCGCKDTGKYEIYDLDSSVVIECEKCGQKLEYFCDESPNTTALMEATKITLK